jgi:bla regulator protein blaR1
MNWINEILPQGLIEALGWTFFHSLWLGALIALSLGAILILIDNKNADLRYKISIAAFFIFVISTGYIFLTNYDPINNSLVSKNSLSQSIQLKSYNFLDAKDADAVSNSSSIYSAIKKYFESNFPLVITLWLIGLMFFSLRFLGGILFLQKIRTQGIKELDIEWIYRARELARRINVKTFIPVYESLNVSVPIVIGFIKPVVLLPIGLVSGLPYRQVEAIIAHELAHIKRYDYLVNLFQSFIETIFFYHPAVWWISTQLREERENCCDDIALENCGDAITYSKALYNLQSVKSNQPNLALAAGGKVNQLLRRIKRMNGEKRKLSSGGRFAASIIVFILIGSAVVISSASDTGISKNTAIASFINPLSFIEGNSPTPSKSIIPDTSSIKKGNKTLKFYEEEKRFKAKLNNGKLEKLYIDGEEVETKDFEKYEKRITEKAEEYDAAVKGYDLKMEEYKETTNRYREEMKAYREKMNKFSGTRNKHWDFEFDFPHKEHFDFAIPSLDSTELKRIMEDVQCNLKKHFKSRSIKIPPIHIPKIHIPKIDIPPIDIEELECDLKEHEFDKEEFKKSMNEWKEDFSVGMKKLNEELKNAKWNTAGFKESMKHLSKNMDKLKVEMKILKEYLHEVKEELINDKLIDESDDLDGFYLSKDEMKVNGEKVSPALLKKYLEIYKKHYGKELSDDQKIQIND